MIENLNLYGSRIYEKYDSYYGNIRYSKPTKTPFIVVLHSLGKNENSVIHLSNILPENAFVLSVRAPIEWRVDGDESFAWFDIKGPMIEQFCKESDIIESIEHLILVIEECKSKFTNLDDPIIIGFSQGGIIGLTMAVEKYYKLKGVFCHCGFYEKKLNKNFDNIETNILITNGLNDYIIPLVWAEQSKEILSKKCENFQSLFLNCGHEVNDEVLTIMNQWVKKII